MLRFMLLVVLLTLWPSAPVAAQSEPHCFPQTGFCISDRFRQFWEQNGGLPVFGYPIAAAAPERNRDTGQVYLTQWFERNRFELHLDRPAPYDVLLGRLGDDRLLQLNIDWRTLPVPEAPVGGCLWFPETRHTVCDQAPGLGFKSYWQSHGLNDASLDPFRRSLALFGLPLSEPAFETNAAGDRVLTQWFERARFEWHPDKPDAFKVLLGLLGNEVRSGPNPAQAVTMALPGQAGRRLVITPQTGPPAPSTPAELLASSQDVVAGSLEVGRDQAVGSLTLFRGIVYRVVVRQGTIYFLDTTTGRLRDPRLKAEVREMLYNVSPPEAIVTRRNICYSWQRVQVCTEPGGNDLLTSSERGELQAAMTTTLDRLVGNGTLTTGSANTIRNRLSETLPDVEGNAALTQRRASIVATPAQLSGIPALTSWPSRGLLVGALWVSLEVETPTGPIRPGDYAVTIKRNGDRWLAELKYDNDKELIIPVDYRPVLGQLPGERRTMQVILHRLCFLDWCIPGRDELGASP